MPVPAEEEPTPESEEPMPESLTEPESTEHVPRLMISQMVSGRERERSRSCRDHVHAPLVHTECVLPFVHTPLTLASLVPQVVENFKSYAGRRVVGPFHKCFTSIVGPNGSGKSNNIDAMLFVFGKKAKKLRLNKLSELIHSSDQFTGANELKECSVEVHFHDILDTGDGDEDYEVVTGSATVVKRVCRKIMRLNHKTHEEEEADESWYEMGSSSERCKKVVKSKVSAKDERDSTRTSIRIRTRIRTRTRTSIPLRPDPFVHTCAWLTHAPPRSPTTWTARGSTWRTIGS